MARSVGLRVITWISMATNYSAEPFPHWVIDDFLPPEDAWAAYQHFYEGDGAWTKREHLYCHAKETRTESLHPAVERALTQLESPGIRQYVGQISDLPGLLHDPERFGGGQHVIRRGGFLGVHADFTHSPTTGHRRVLNLLLYLNAHWHKGDGGELELWASDMSQCAVKVEPIFNRAVLFRTSTTSFHGHPEPLKGEERRSLAVYYYNPDEPKQYIVTTGPSATQYNTLQWITTTEGHLRTTDYRPRPWEYKLRARRWLSKLLKG